MKKVLILICCLCFIGCNIKEAKLPKSSPYESKIAGFICKTIKWHQFWFQKWDKKMIDDYSKLSKVELMIITTYSNNDNITHLEVYNPNLNCIFYIAEENNFLYLQRMEDDADLKPTGKNTKEYFTDRYNSSVGKHYTLNGKCNDIAATDKDFIFDETKTNLTKAVIQEFIENAKTFEKIPRKFKRMLKNGSKLTVYVGNYYDDYPNLILLVQDVPCLVVVTRDHANNIIMNDVINKDENLLDKYLIKKVLNNGTKFVWKSNSVE